MVVKKESVSIYLEDETVVSHDSCRKGAWKSEDVYKAMASCPTLQPSDDPSARTAWRLIESEIITLWQRPQGMF